VAANVPNVRTNGGVLPVGVTANLGLLGKRQETKDRQAIAHRPAWITKRVL
jgi:hypothetical protein